MAMMNWHIVSTKAEFIAGSPVDTDLYFIADTHEIYRGSESYTQPIVLYSDALPVENIAVNALYINSTTLKGDVYNGTKWTTVLKPLASSIEPDGDGPVTGSAVATYVAAEIAKISGSGNVVTKITWDDANQILDVFKGEGKESITFDGLGVSLQYTSSTGVLQLLDTSGNTIGDPVNLGVEKFVTGGEYDSARQVIILYFDEDHTESVEIPVGDLVHTYTVGNTKTVNMNLSGSQITANVRISVTGGNALVANDDGLFVSVPDITGKMDKVSGATAGNLASLDSSGQVVDSGVAATAIHETVLFTGTTTPEEAVGGATPKKGDLCVITKTISGGYAEKTAYEYNGTQWVALDGNYNAENVYFAKDLITTSAVGNITLTNGQATIPAAGKNLKQVFDAIFVKEKNPTVTQPSVSVTCPQAKTYEVGESVTPSYTATLNAGSYQYGPATGITATAWSVQNTNSNQLTTNTGTFDAIQVTDDTDYYITATANYNAGAIPVTNVGNEYAAGQIQAGSKTGTSAHIRGYRAGFYGTLTTKDGTIDSALVRALATKTTAAPAKGNVWNMPIPAGAIRLVFAYQASLGDVASVQDVNGMNAEVKTAFTKNTVSVEGAAGYTGVNYNVYVYDLAEAVTTPNTYKITL